MAKTPGKREINSEAKKELILENSLELFRKYGYEKITVTDICKECGINVGTLYHYFGSKVGVLQAISDKLSPVSVLEENDPELLQNPAEAITHFLLNYASRWETLGVDLTTQIFQNFQKIYVNPFTSILNETDSIDKLSRFIKASQQIGCFDPSAKPVKTANLIMIVGRGVVYDWCMQSGMYDLSEKAREVSGLLKYLVAGDGDIVG